MGASIMNKFMSVLGLEDKEVVDEVENYEIENTFTDVETSSNLLDDMSLDHSNEEELKEEVEEKAPFSFYKPRKKEKEKEMSEYMPNISRRSQTKVLPMTSTATAKMIISHPQSFDEIKEIADNIKEKKSVIINLESVSHEEGRRIIDFLSGTAHALDGTIQKVSKLIFLVAPKDIEVQDESEKYNYSSKLNMSWLKK